MDSLTFLFITLLGGMILIHPLVVEGIIDISSMLSVVARTNWGIILYKGPAILNGFTKYKHTFQIPIPTFDFTPLTPFACNTDDLKLLHCEAINELVQSVNIQTISLAEDARARIVEWTRDIPDIDVGRSEDLARAEPKVRNKRETTGRKLLQTGTNLGSDYCDRLRNGDLNQENTGGGVLSRAWSSLTGSPSWDDIRTVDNHICELADTVDVVKDEIIKSEKALESASVTFNGRMDAIEGGMRNINDRVSETNELLNNLSRKEYSDINYVQSLATRSIEGVDVIMRVQRHLYEFMQDISELESRVTEFGMGINILMEGRLPPQMISSSAVQTVIDGIELNEYEGMLRLVDSSTSFYYLLEDISFTRSAETRSLYIMLNFPLYSSGNGVLAAYRVDKTHINIHEGSVATTRIDNVPDYLAVTPDGLYYSELSTSELYACKGNLIRLCVSQRSLQSFSALTCAAAIYKDDAVNIMALCDIRYESTPVAPGAVRMGDNSYLVHSNKAVTVPGTVWNLVCPLIPQSTPSTIPACGTCIVTVDCGCELTAPGEFLIPMQLSDCSPPTNPIFPTVIPRFPVNLAVLHSLFTVDDLREISGETVKNNRWTYDYPDLSANSNDWNQAVEISQKYSSDLKVLTGEIAESREVFATRADAMLKKATDLSDLDKAHLTSLENIVTSIEWLNVLNPSVTVSGVVVTIVIAIITLLMGIVNCYLIRRR